jgi:hypothetical protein
VFLKRARTFGDWNRGDLARLSSRCTTGRANEGGSRTSFEKRALHFAGTLSSVPLIEDGVNVIHRDDTRYRRQSPGNRFKRTGHAVTASWVAHRPDAGRTPPIGSRPGRMEVGWSPPLWSPAICGLRNPWRVGNGWPPSHCGRRPVSRISGRVRRVAPRRHSEPSYSLAHRQYGP